MAEHITSARNPKIKNLIHLKKGSTRKKLHQIIIEGQNEILRALKSGVRIDFLFACRDFLQIELNDLTNSGLSERNIFTITPEIFNHVAYRHSSGGLIAVASPIKLAFSDLQAQSDSIYLVLESVEKPGNLGAILRTADAAGVDGVIVCDPQTDIYNPNVIRSSLGCVFNVKTITATSQDTLHWLKENEIRSFATHLKATKYYQQQDFSGKIAIIMGTESDGLTEFWENEADHLIKIPMLGEVDSMNVSVSTAIVLFEALRQRNFMK